MASRAPEKPFLFLLKSNQTCLIREIDAGSNPQALPVFSSWTNGRLHGILSTV